jgi:arylsulfatase A-like enzyme
VHSVKRHYGIRTEHYKLIHFYYDIDCWELFDLKKDPLELTNLYDDPAYAQVVKKLKAELMRLKKEFGDTSDRYTIPKKNYEK